MKLVARRSEQGVPTPQRSLRPIRVALVNFGPEDSTLEFKTTLSPLGVSVYSAGQVPEDLFDLVALTGDLSLLGKRRLPEGWESVLAFQPSAKFREAKGILRKVDSVILCEDRETLVVRQFFESLMVPSLLNIDLADVAAMARGIGLALRASGIDGKEVVSKLPERCYVAKAGLLHFSCSDDVTLREVYDISRRLASDEVDQNKVRKVNVKIGLRIRPQSAGEEERIRLTAILFGF